MKNRYEALLILNIKGGEEAVKETLERLEGEFTSEGAAVEAIQKLERRQFSYTAGKLDSGYYANFIFEADAVAIDKLRAKFRLDGDVYQQFYKKLGHRKAAA